MFSLSWKIHGYIKMYQHPTTTHTSYVCNALGLYTMEYPRCHLHFLRTHTVFKLCTYVKEKHVHVTYGLYHVIVIIIIISFIQYAHCDWSILQSILYCTAH